ncbi:hypothetical protein KUTeg_007419 [Tegillarca granosa]|uniref:Uncharacterized protein n=1 Tax=Tegillarca granosa TaxID=220873 RepID=A0ABQ9FD86_TEGGR|nr:hypothetical protein KUTeg_007419 [Tegillarca granosa]
MNVIPCLTWVRRGVSKNTPDRFELLYLCFIYKQVQWAGQVRKIDDETEDIDEDNDNEIEEDEPNKNSSKNEKLGKRKHDDEEEEDAEGAGHDIDDIAAKYGLDDYDNDDQDKGNFLQGIGHLVYHADDEDDPYITLKGERHVFYVIYFKQMDSDEEDFEIKATDNIIVAGRAKKDACSLEIHGSFVAVGSMEPTIEIWDLDVVDSLEPVAVLGAKVKKKNKKKGTVGHTDAVLDLSWNSNVRHVLASASADFTAGIWDLSQGKIATTDKGLVYYIDSRQDKPVFTLSAHSEAVTGICQSSQVPGLLVTTSTDGAFKVWDVQDNKPSSILDRNLKMGQIQSLGGCPEAPFVFAIGGEEDLKVWDIRESAAVRRHFYSRAPPNVTMETVEGTEEQEIAGATATALETLSIDSKPNKKKKNKNKKKSDSAKADDDDSVVLDELDIDNSLQQNEEKKKKKKRKKKKKQEES